MALFRPWPARTPSKRPMIGAPILGRFEGELAGHGINNQLVRALLARPDAWRVRTFADELAIAV